MHSDRGPYFDNQEIQEFSCQYGIKWVFGAPGVAKSQGKIERAIQDVKRSLRTLVQDKPNTWSSKVSAVQLAFNTHFIYASDMTPFKLLFGFQPRNPVQNLVQPPSLASKCITQERQGLDVDKLRCLRLAKLDEVRESLIDLQTKRWDEYLEKHDWKGSWFQYEVGDWVLFQGYQLMPFGNAFKSRWKGPVLIIKVTRKVKIDLRHPTGEVMKGWHTDKIKPYYTR